MKFTFFYDVKNAVHLQNIVKRTDGRFEGNLTQSVSFGKGQVSVKFDSPDNYHAFHIALSIMEQPYF